MKTKNELLAHIQSEQHLLALDIREIHLMRRSVVQRSSAVFSDPLKALDQTLVYSLTRRQKWEAIALAFVAGSLTLTMRKNEPLALPKIATLHPLLRSVIEPIVKECVEETQRFGRRIINTLFQTVEHLGGK